jgi:hypothetical protein
MPERFSKVLSGLQAELPALTVGEFWIIVILAVAIVATSVFVFLKPRT